MDEVCLCKSEVTVASSVAVTTDWKAISARASTGIASYLCLATCQKQPAYQQQAYQTYNQKFTFLHAKTPLRSFPPSFLFTLTRCDILCYKLLSVPNIRSNSTTLNIVALNCKHWWQRRSSIPRNIYDGGSGIRSAPRSITWIKCWRCSVLKYSAYRAA